MPYIQDSTQSFTISLTALLEGLGIITYIEVANMTQFISYEWSLGAWITSPPEAVEADSIIIIVEVENQGATPDTLYGEFVSAQVTPPENSIQEMPDVSVGFSQDVSWSFTMPPNNVSITINAGHVE